MSRESYQACIISLKLSQAHYLIGIYLLDIMLSSNNSPPNSVPTHSPSIIAEHHKIPISTLHNVISCQSILVDIISILEVNFNPDSKIVRSNELQRDNNSLIELAQGVKRRIIAD